MIKEQNLSVIRLDISGKMAHIFKLALTWKSNGTLADVTFDLRDSSTQMIVKCVKGTEVEKEIIEKDVLGNVLDVSDGLLVTIEGTDLKQDAGKELYDGFYDRALDNGISDANIITVFNG